MERKHFSGLIAGVAIVMFGVSSVQAQYTWTGNGADNNWTTDGNWSGGTDHPDGSGETAKFDSGQSITVVLDADITLGELSVLKDGSNDTVVLLENTSSRQTLSMVAGASTSGQLIVEVGDTDPEDNAIRLGQNVTLAFDSAGITHEIGGMLELAYSDGFSVGNDDESIIHVKADEVAFGPHNTNDYGFVLGSDVDGDARIKIDDPASNEIRLINNVTVAGVLVIEPEGSGAGDAIFENAPNDASDPASGRVLANGGGILEMANGLIVEDDDTVAVPLWVADGSSAELLFNTSAGASGTRLEGNFVGDNDALIQINEEVYTWGTLDLNNMAELCADSDSCFKFGFNQVCNGSCL